MSDRLARLGWTALLADAFAEYAAEGLVPGRVALEHTHIYRVITEAGESLARVSGRLRHRAAARADFPAVGDWVAVQPPPRAGDSRIVAVLPRRSRFSRRAAGDPTEEQVVASNIDTVFLVAGLDGDFNPRRIERYLLVASESGASPVIVLNKADVAADANVKADIVRTSVGAVPIHVLSCRVPGEVDVLRQYLGIRTRPAHCSGRQGWGSRRSSTVSSGMNSCEPKRCANRTAVDGTRAVRVS